jgi:hypothetical protein
VSCARFGEGGGVGGGGVCGRGGWGGGGGGGGGVTINLNGLPVQAGALSCVPLARLPDIISANLLDTELAIK